VQRCDTERALELTPEENALTAPSGEGCFVKLPSLKGLAIIIEFRFSRSEGLILLPL
jgi:hypothetical protein